MNSRPEELHLLYEFGKSNLEDITKYGDLFIHELYEENGIYTHRIEFDGATLSIKAKKVVFEEVINVSQSELK